jgi:hypothetical protein
VFQRFVADQHVPVQPILDAIPARRMLRPDDLVPAAARPRWLDYRDETTLEHRPVPTMPLEDRKEWDSDR